MWLLLIIYIKIAEQVLLWTPAILQLSSSSITPPQVGVAVITHASHLCGPGIESWAPHVGWDLSISIWLRGFFSGYSGFPPSLTLCSEVTHGPFSGCQEAPIYAFGPTSLSCAASVVWGGDECKSFFFFLFHQHKIFDWFLPNSSVYELIKSDNSVSKLHWLLNYFFALCLQKTALLSAN